MTVKGRVSVFLKTMATAAAMCGVVTSFITAEADGYSHWSKRLLYFTGLSNIWIALTFAAILSLPLLKLRESGARVKNFLYILKYIFTVSITLTAFIFCAVLAPGAANDGYEAWTVSSVMTHILAPVLSIADFFLDPYKITIRRPHILYTLLPPLAYLVFAGVLGAFGVDFGRGDSFPYFFLNFNSPAGIFGTSDEMPYKIGSFYWIIFILCIILTIVATYRRIYNGRNNKKQRQ